MSDSEHDTTPWKNDPNVQALFDQAKADLGSDEQVANVGKRLGPLLVGGALLGSGKVALGSQLVAQKAAWLSVGWVKVSLLSVVLVGLSAVGIWVAREPPAPETKAVSAPRAEIAPMPRKELQSEANEAPEPVPLEAEPGPSAPTSRVQATPPPESREPKAREAQLLLQAQQALSQSPARALELVQAHQALFPKSKLAEEREVLRIKALAELGRAEDAERETSRFKEKYPKSIHRGQLHEATGE